jgi:hypothetical protein
MNVLRSSIGDVPFQGKRTTSPTTVTHVSGQIGVTSTQAATSWPPVTDVKRSNCCPSLYLALHKLFTT